MSTHETQRQLEILNQIRKAGGQGYKASNAYTAGILDLSAVSIGFAPYKIEVKDLKEVGPRFRRKVTLSRLQEENLKQMNAVNPGRTVGFVMVTYKQGGRVHVSSIPSTQTHVTEAEQWTSTLSNLSENIHSHLSAMGVPKI